MTLAGLQAQVHAILSRANAGGIEPEADLKFEVRQLLTEALSLSPVDLILKSDSEIPPAMRDIALHWAERRATGYPLAYLSGKKGFYKHTFLVEPGVLVPRPETELLVEHILNLVQKASAPIRHFADLGCGTGCIGLSLLKEWVQATLFALDISALATEVTKKNAVALGLETRVQVVQSAVASWQSPYELDLVVANPPYIAEGDLRVQAGVHLHEPHSALYSGADGLTAIKDWVDWSERNLRDGGVLVLEIGSGQSPQVQAILKERNFESIQSVLDLAGHDRVVSASKRK